MENETEGWRWYHATSGEGHYSGPYDTRDDAIEGARSEYGDDVGFYVAEATNPPLKLSDWCNFDTLLERADDNVFDNERADYAYDETGVFVVTPEEEKRLIEALTAACDAWQNSGGHTFTVRTFRAIRSHGFIPPLTSDEEAPDVDA